MLRHTNDLGHFSIRATDGLIGKVKDLYFDDDAWVVRYLVVDAGNWLSSRKVLISPISVRRPDWMQHTFPVALTREQVRHSPDIDTDKPVSRQHEESVLTHYGYPAYWGGIGLWGAGIYPYGLVPGDAGDGLDLAAREQALEAHLRAERLRHRNDDPHLRSCQAVTGYHLHATDGDIGHVSGFLVDDETWSIRYLVVDTSNWWVGHKALIAPPWILGVEWATRTVSVDLTRAAIRDAPPYDAGRPWSRDLEFGLYRHHGREGYWAGSEPALSAA
jgi:PRC-barrel domain